MTSMEHEAIKLGPGHNPQDLELEEGEVSRVGLFATGGTQSGTRGGLKGGFLGRKIG